LISIPILKNGKKSNLKHIFIIYIFNVFIGTIQNGNFDKIIGPAGRDGYAYDWDALESGLVARAISKTKSYLPTKHQIDQLRKQSTITCGQKIELNDTKLCHPEQGEICLFDLDKDPCEMENLADEFEDVKYELLELLAQYNETVVPPRNQPRDPASNPK
jgi:arylsulfatase B